MARELALDMAHGLVGKTAIHPGQIEVIQNALMVTQGEHSDALRILNSTRAVFKSQEQCVNHTSPLGGWHSGQSSFYGLQNEQSADGIRLLTVTQHH
uniref:Citrate lyase beta subunit n=1 Tax=Escherichia coli TaxID=562 RepID=A0A6G9HHT8_ECOLX|nr:citrate lyase beta subunit [Escherichia coli]